MRMLIYLPCLLILFSCSNTKSEPVADNQILDLKRGAIITCGPQEGEIFGSVLFKSSVPKEFQKDFNTAVALLHSFEYDEAEKMFAKVIDGSTESAMAYWGVAMSNFHPLWAPPSPEELQKGMKAVEIARSIKNKTKRESDYIEAIGQLYEETDSLDHRSRVLNFEKAMEDIYHDYPG